MSSCAEGRKVPCEEDFEVIKLVSQGAYGSVYLVRHTETRQRFALKKILKRSMMLRNQIEQVFAERDIMSFADNPFVVSMYCSFETKKYLCLVMEYVEGGDCASLLKVTGPLTNDIAKFYFAETVLAVEYLHSYGIVHRDLKPDNLLITALGHIKLTDFGLSKMGLMSLATHLYEVYIDKDTKQFSDKQVHGTPEYIAPEVILRQGYGKPVDWWSMGIVLYEFLIGCVPFFGETPEELFAHTVNDDIEWPDEDDWPVQAYAKDLVTALLHQNPRDRLGTGGAHEVKRHEYFHNVDWDSLLRQKAEFVPQLSGEEDTSYFDSRTDRFKADIAVEDKDDGQSFSVGSFSSCSVSFRKAVERKSSSGAESISSNSRNSSMDATAASSCEVELSPPLLTTESSCGAHLLDDSCEAAGIKAKSEEDDAGNEAEDEDDSRRVAAFTAESASQVETEASPQIVRRSLLSQAASIPKFSISVDKFYTPTPRSIASEFNGELIRSSGPKEKPKSQRLNLVEVQQKHQLQNHHQHYAGQMWQQPQQSLFTPIKHKSRSSAKTSTASGLSLFIPDGNSITTPLIQSPGGGSSTASSRDTSPCQEMSPLISSLKPPIVIRRGPSGFGFTVHTVRVYFGDTYFYTMHHLVMAVDAGSPAFESGLRPGDLITHVNGELVQGLYHTQVLQLLLSGGDQVTLRATPLENTSIRNDGKKRLPGQGRLASRKSSIHSRQKKGNRKDVGSSTPTGEVSRKKPIKSNILNRINIVGSAKKPACAPKTPANLPPAATAPTSSYHAALYGRSMSMQEPIDVLLPLAPTSPQVKVPTLLDVAPVTPEFVSPASSSSSSSNSPSMTPSNSCYQRPSSLHGLKHKLATHSPNRRKSIGHIPLSPLARTPSPSPLPSSPTRSPSPLIFPPGHHPGSSNTTQSYSPSVVVASSAANAVALSSIPTGNSVAGSSPAVSSCMLLSVTPKKLGKAKTSEPRSPLFRRAVSPDRLLASSSRSAEVKSNFISPLCDPELKVTLHSPRITVTSKSPPHSYNKKSTPSTSTTYTSSCGSLTLVATTSRTNVKVDCWQKCDRLEEKEESVGCGGSKIDTASVKVVELPHIVEEKESHDTAAGSGELNAAGTVSSSTLKPPYVRKSANK